MSQYTPDCLDDLVARVERADCTKRTPPPVPTKHAPNLQLVSIATTLGAHATTELVDAAYDELRNAGYYPTKATHAEKLRCLHSYVANKTRTK